MDETVPRDPPTPSAAPERAPRPAGTLLAARAAIGTSAALIAETRAGFHQRQVDMEVAATRRQLLRMARWTGSTTPGPGRTWCPGRRRWPSSA